MTRRKKRTTAGDTTICLPMMVEGNYEALVKDTPGYRAYLDQMIELHRELFPVGIDQGYRFHGFVEWNHLAGLYSHPGRGRKSSFTPEQKTQIKEWVKENPKNLTGVLSKIKETWNITTSKDTIKRILKSLLMSWNRVHRVVFEKPDAHEYPEKSSN